MTRTVVVGFGVTGQAVARVALDAGDEVIVFDDRVTEAVAAAARRTGVAVQATPTGSALAAAVAGYDRVVPSPGVPVAHPVYAAAANAGIDVVSEIEMAYQALDRPGAPRLVAITGTNGKTTVTTLVTSILNRAGAKAVAAGNIGAPLVEAVGGDADVVVAEVSSFQLQYTRRFRPAVACWLNLAPDHLDWHPSHEHYAAAKARIWANQGAGDTAVFNVSDPEVRAAAEMVAPEVTRVGFSAQEPADWCFDGENLLGPDGSALMPASELGRAFPHDIANALAAAATATAAGADAAACRRALADAAVLPHRVELVGRSRGVSYYDDSKATTPASVLAAVRGFESVVLIAGGRNKGLDLAVLGSTVPPVRAVVAIGEAAAEVRRAFAGRVPVEDAADMAVAVSKAAVLARPGDAVLLSPGCASFDWYSSYAARGEDFSSLVRKDMEKGDTPW